MIYGAIGLVAAFAGTSIGHCIKDATTSSLLEGIGQVIGDILIIIGSSILKVYALIAIVYIVYMFILYLLDNCSNGGYW